jgi:hemoglobin-like flavoprotein
MPDPAGPAVSVVEREGRGSLRLARERRGMNPLHLSLIRTSYQWFRPCGPAMVAKVLRELADGDPELGALFATDDPRRAERFFKTLGQVVRFAHEFERLEPALAELGRSAAYAGASARHYTIARNQLLANMAELAGDDWSDDLRNAWEGLLLAAGGAMLAGTIPQRRAA